MLNENVVLVSPQLVLIPYLPHHVPQYHRWMSDPELLLLTASEPLSYEEEVENQQSWLRSLDKLTFILCPRKQHDLKEGGTQHSVSEALSIPPHNNIFLASVRNSLSQAVGDCNAFILNDPNKADDYDDADTQNVWEIELDVAVAERSARCQGLGCASVKMMMWYVFSNIVNCTLFPKMSATPKGKIVRFVAKILRRNEPSRQLFERKLLFTQYKEVKQFDEVHYKKEWKLSDFGTEASQDSFSSFLLSSSKSNIAELGRNEDKFANSPPQTAPRFFQLPYAEIDIEASMKGIEAPSASA